MLAMKIFAKQSISRRKQRGATLFISLVFLTLMTIVTVSAAKIASLDSVVASNNQQQMMVYQQTAKTLELINNPVIVIQSIIDNEGVLSSWTKEIPSNETSTENSLRSVNSRSITYPCQNNGSATRLEASCALIDLSSEDRLVATGITDRHFRGVGKAIPTNPGYTD